MTMTHAQHAQPHYPPRTSTPQPTTAHSSSTLNLSVLRRYLPTTTSIESIAAYSVIYIFNPTQTAWEKSGIEGTLFLLCLDGGTQAESYAVFVLNRRGLENFALGLGGREEVECTEEYVIVRDTTAGGGEGGERIWGLWIFEEEGGSTAGSRERVGGRILECAGRGRGGGMGALVDGGEGQQYRRDEGAEGGQGPDLMALLNGSGGQGGGGVRAERPANSDQGQALLDLFRKAG